MHVLPNEQDQKPLQTHASLTSIFYQEFLLWLIRLRTAHSVCEDAGLIPGLTWVKASGLAPSCGVSRRCGSDPPLLWLWHKPAAAAPTPPLALELPYATGVALKRKKRKKNAGMRVSRSADQVENPKSCYCDFEVFTDLRSFLLSWAPSMVHLILFECPFPKPFPAFSFPQVYYIEFPLKMFLF